MLKNSTAIFCGKSEIHIDINGSGFSISNSEPAIVLAQCGILIISYDNPGRHLRVYIAEHMNRAGLGG